MLVYLINLGFVWVMSILAVKFSTKPKGQFEVYKKPNLVFVVIALIPLILVCGLRWRVGTDYNNYVDLYYLNSTGDFWGALQTGDPAFSVLAWFCSRIIYEPQIMFMVCSIFITTIIVLGIRDYSCMFELSMFLYITEMTYYSQFNGVRQWIASAIIFFAFRYLIREQRNKYFICVLVAASFHISALVLIPLYFTIKLKPWSKYILLLVTSVVISFLMFPQVMDVLFNIFEGRRYQVYLKPMEGDDGVNLLRVLVAAIPVIISLIYHKKIINDKKVSLLVNLSLFNFIFLFLATRSTVIARMCFYFGPYNILLIPELVRLEKSKFKYIIYVIVMVMFMLYMILLLPRDSHLLPYRTIFQRT